MSTSERLDLRWWIGELVAVKQDRCTTHMSRWSFECCGADSGLVERVFAEERHAFVRLRERREKVARLSATCSRRKVV